MPFIRTQQSITARPCEPEYLDSLGYCENNAIALIDENFTVADLARYEVFKADANFDLGQKVALVIVDAEPTVADLLERKGIFLSKACADIANLEQVAFILHHTDELFYGLDDDEPEGADDLQEEIERKHPGKNKIDTNKSVLDLKEKELTRADRIAKRNLTSKQRDLKRGNLFRAARRHFLA